MLETIRIRKNGFPIRHPFQDFFDKYRILTNFPKKTVDVTTMTQFVSKLSLDEDQWQLGLTKVFLRDSQVAKLEDQRRDSLKRCVIRIQKTWRMYWIRFYYVQYKKSTIKLQSCINIISELSPIFNYFF
jgi:myosin heavy subunit